MLILSKIKFWSCIQIISALVIFSFCLSNSFVMFNVYFFQSLSINNHYRFYIFQTSLSTKIYFYFFKAYVQDCRLIKKLPCFGKNPKILFYVICSQTGFMCRYTVYSLNLTQMLTSSWLNQTTLLVVCGSVPTSLSPILLQYVLNKGGMLMCLCSDLLGVFLPIFRTAEVRPDQLVTFSYSHWKHVRLMHHIFCYQPSSSAKFSSADESR